MLLFAAIALADPAVASAPVPDLGGGWTPGGYRLAPAMPGLTGSVREALVINPGDEQLIVHQVHRFHVRLLGDGRHASAERGVPRR